MPGMMIRLTCRHSQSMKCGVWAEFPTCFTGENVANKRDGKNVGKRAKFWKGLELGWHPGWKKLGEDLKVTCWV